MLEAEINYLAVIIAAALTMPLGFLWYGSLFGKEWMRLMKFSESQIEAMKKGGMSKTYVISLVGALVMAYVLAHFVYYAQATTVVEGLQVGFWTWLGFVATTMLGGVLYGSKPWRLYQIDTGYHLASLLIMGVVLAVWV